MKNRKVYITSVDEAANHQHPASASVVPVELLPYSANVQQQHIPSIDLTMSLNKHQQLDHTGYGYDPEETQQINAPLPGVCNGLEIQQRGEHMDK